LLELKDWIEKTKFATRQWVLLGKGPSFSRRFEVNLENYNTFSLNHVVREQRVNVAHIIDIEVIEPCGYALLTNCDWLIMPRRPHVNCFVSQYLDLQDWIRCIPALEEVERRGRLVTYSFSHEPVPEDPWTVDARFFSSEIALGILARMGVKSVKSLGIDGGKKYSNAFDDLQANTLLMNGQPSFDLQFERLEELCVRYGMTFTPLLEASDHDFVRDTAPGSNSDMVIVNGSQERASAVSKIQKMEIDIRTLTNELAQANELLYLVTKELSVCSQRLGWSQDEVKEYRERVLELERQVHALYKSKTWKIGRVVTKPAEAIGKQFSTDHG
jgi:hypothetical protein